MIARNNRVPCAGVHGVVLDLATRLDICIDVAHALTYLHLYAGQILNVNADVAAMQHSTSSNLHHVTRKHQLIAPPQAFGLSSSHVASSGEQVFLAWIVRFAADF